MKRLACVMICLICVFAFVLAMPVAAITVDPQDITGERRAEILENLDVKLLGQEIIERSICCFDVNEEGLIAVGLDESRSRRRVQVYDAAGYYLYGYEFSCSGSFWVEFEGDNLTIYFVRGQLLATFTPEGQCVSVKTYRGSAGDALYVTQKVCGSKTYRMERDIGFHYVFSRLTVTDADGAKITLYDETAIHNIRTLCVYASVVGFIAVWAYLVFVKPKRGQKGTDCHTSVRTGSQ